MVNSRCRQDRCLYLCIQARSFFAREWTKRIEPRESKPSWSNLLLEEVKTVEVERWLRAADLEECRLFFHTPVALVSCFFVAIDASGSAVTVTST